ncbi:hypothetical protein [Paenibacillus xerothermodurans]|uniref:Uncharacterized protein n=1 Tax=Paenibacillus xerothermodurans TaxID=1977292 RepID=A0A2W1NRD3_PAEXE|nr:hypothetical protein [Paenibacillus xerothermodurans]PZE22085.1 hypothetical protein CBW46_006750 [Paenibacillus xerothermodurans]
MSNSDFDADFERLFDEAAEDSDRMMPFVIPEPRPSWMALHTKLQRELRTAAWIRTAKWGTPGSGNRTDRR